jgi:hypothetical protein
VKSDDDNPLHLFKKPVQPSREVKVKMHCYEQLDDSIDIRYRNTGIPPILTFTKDKEEQKGQVPPSPKPQAARPEFRMPLDHPLTPSSRVHGTSTSPKFSLTASPLNSSVPNSSPKFSQVSSSKAKETSSSPTLNETVTLPKPRPFNPLDSIALVVQPELIPQKELNVPAPPPQQIETDFEESSPLVMEHYDKFEYLLRLEKETLGWTLKINKPNAKISLKQGSMYNADLPVVRAEFDMELDLKPQDLYFILFDVSTRMSWDSSSVLEYVEFDRLNHDCVLYYMQNKAPWPFSNRDFVERRFTRQRKNGDLEVFYSAISHSAYPERSRVERGATIIGGQLFRRKLKPDGRFTLVVTSISQADMKGKVPAKALQETLPSSLEKWYRSVKAVVQARQ